jgi:PPOX class probable F420-dependent enzyme
MPFYWTCTIDALRVGRPDQLKGTSMNIDTSTDFGQRVTRRLQEERIVWLTTVRADGRPEPSPVWFHWDGESIVIYSQPDTVKIRNIAARPNVALSLNSDYYGGDVVIISGEARIIPDVLAFDAFPALVEKYRENLDIPNSLTTKQFTTDYSVAIQIALTRLRGF